MEGGTVRVKCLAQEHGTVSLARAWTKTTPSLGKCTNHESCSVPPHCYKGSALILNLFFNKLDNVTNTEQDGTTKSKDQRIKTPARSQEIKKGDTCSGVQLLEAHLWCQWSKIENNCEDFTWLSVFVQLFSTLCCCMSISLPQNNIMVQVKLCLETLCVGFLLLALVLLHRFIWIFPSSITNVYMKVVLLPCPGEVLFVTTVTSNLTREWTN